jgi:antagonist of KipI
MGVIEILSPGLQTSVQDLGRPGHEHLGISPGGAADPVSLEAGNLLVGNPPGASALEMTLAGASFRFESETHFALTGADMGATLSDRPVLRWETHVARAGETLRLGPARQGCRAYLCMAGGVDVPLVLGSASTHIQSGVGGFEGRALKRGDRVKIGKPGRPRPGQVDARELESRIFGKVFRVTRSIHTGLFATEAWGMFLRQEYSVSERSNRLGLRLEGESLGKIPEVVTAGVSLGTIQISSDGKPTILFIEQQLTGGYPQIACVIRDDLAAVGQLKPRDRIRFEEVAP